MNNKLLSAIFLLLLASQGLLLFLQPIQMNSTGIDTNLEDALVENFATSAIDLDRVNLLSEAIPNGDVEDWNTPHDPSVLTTDRSAEHKEFYEYSIVNEGSRAVGLQARGTDINHVASAQIYLDSWMTSSHPNLTISLDWNIQEFGFPDLGDRLELYLPFGGGTVRYCMVNGSVSALTNTTSTVYFIIDGNLQTWNTLQRNVTSDFIEAFGYAPGSLSRFSFYVHSSGFQYTTVIIDDFHLVSNGTTVIGDGVNHGNFEHVGTGAKWTDFMYNDGSGDISQSTDKVEGDYSLNVTVNSPGAHAYSEIHQDIERLVSEDNRDVFSFWWKIADLQLDVSSSYSYVKVVISNVTTTYNVYYILAQGGPTVSDFRSNPTKDLQFNMDNINETSDWTSFNTSIYEDIQSERVDTNMFIEEILFYTHASTAGARLCVLFDDISLVSDTLTDRDYEDKGTIGSNVYGWSDNILGSNGFTVTDFSAQGDKAGNLTLIDDDEASPIMHFNELNINSENEMVLDVTWYIESYNDTSSEDFCMLYLSFDNGDVLYYNIMNATSLSDTFVSEDDNPIYMPETNTVGEWINWKIDIAHDIEEATGEFPNTTLKYLMLWGYANESSEFTVFIDDFYLYEDSAPEITDISQTPSTTEAGESAEISVTVVDATEIDAILHHRVGTDDWVNTTMIEAENSVYEANITDLPWDIEVEYFVTVSDAFNKTDDIMDGASYFTLTAADTLDPTVSILTPVNGTLISGSVEVGISAADSGSSVEYVEIYIDDVLAFNDTSSPYSYDWDTTSLVDGEYTIVVIAYDSAGNSAETLHVVTVDNSEPTTTTTDTTSDTATSDTTSPPPEGDLLPIVMIVIIVAGAVVIVVVYLFVLKKN
ncbi:MAG: Ig-like domain-containing protein [Candidatus Thorarchaeota archaeon]